MQIMRTTLKPLFNLAIAALLAQAAPEWGGALALLRIHSRFTHYSIDRSGQAKCLDRYDRI
jgi:hypothetical protein